MQDIASHRVFVSRDVVFEEGQPHRTSLSVGENNIPLFNTTLGNDGTLDEEEVRKLDKGEVIERQTDQPADKPNVDIPNSHTESGDQHDIPTESNQQTENIQPEVRRLSRITKPSSSILQSKEYQQREDIGRQRGEEWTAQARLSLSSNSFSDAQDDYIACLMETRASHNIPRSYRHAMSTDPDHWIIPMKIEMDTLKSKHTWDLVQPPAGANIMDLMWVYDIKWDGEGNRIKDKARLAARDIHSNSESITTRPGQESLNLSPSG